jgi:putative heme-binding domain-containing protein
LALKRQAPPELVRPLVASAVGYGKAQELAGVLALNDGSHPSTLAAFEGLLQGLSRRKWKNFNAADSLHASLEYAARQAADPKLASDRRIEFLRLLGWLPNAKEQETAAVAAILESEQPASVVSAAIEVAGRLRTAATFDVFVRRWNALSPSQRGQALDVLLQSDDGTKTLAAAVIAKKVPLGDIDAARRDRLLGIGNLDLRERLKSLIAPLQANRTAVIAAYKSVDGRHGDAEGGKAVFSKNCAGCHRLDDAGFAVGPDLAMVAAKPVSYLLMEILDPNRNLDARYTGYTVLLNDGRTLTGLLAGESESSLTLLGQDGKKSELLRSEIERLAGQGKSLMPEGLEQHIPPADMADLIAYVRRRLPPPKSFHGNTPKLIATENGRFLLPARFAEVRGATLKFVVPQFALEYWQSMDDTATWEIDVARPGKFIVELDYGVPSHAAGNLMVLEGAEKMFRHQLASTGGWENYKQVRVGEIELGAGRRRLTIKPGGESMREALMDLRAVHLIPK